MLDNIADFTTSSPGIGGSVVECSPAMRAARVRFPADAFSLSTITTQQTPLYLPPHYPGVSTSLIQPVSGDHVVPRQVVDPGCSAAAELGGSPERT